KYSLSGCVTRTSCPSTESSSTASFFATASLRARQSLLHRVLLEQSRSELVQVVAPDNPGMLAFARVEFEFDLVLVQQLRQPLRILETGILAADGDPEQLNFSVRGGGIGEDVREDFFRITRTRHAGAEDSDPTEQIEMREPDVQRLAA